MGVDFFNDDKNTVNFRKDVSLSQGDRSRMLSQLLQSLGSLNAQGMNAAADTANRANLPLASRLAQQRSIELGGARAAQEGSLGIDQYINDTNISGMKFLLEMALNQRGINKQGEFNVNSALAAIGSGAGAIAGGG